MNKLEQAIGYEFRDIGLLNHASTHSSYINEHQLNKEDCNERLEFLGDSILEMVTSDYLYHAYPKTMEGELSKLRASIVCERALAKSAREIGLGEFLILGKGMELGGGRESDAITSDAFEAVLAALYLDGGLEEAKKLIDAHVLNHIEERLLFSDSKTSLQEILQEQGKQVRYELISESGPDHDKSFTVAAYVGDTLMGTGTGHNKKQAEQNAAYETINKIRNT